MSRPPRFLSVSFKFSLVLAALPLVAILLLTFISTRALTQAYEENLQRLGSTITRSVAMLIENAVKGGDYAFQTQALQDSIAATPEVVDAFILKDGEPETRATRGKGEGDLSERRLRLLAQAEARHEVVAVPRRRDGRRFMDFVQDLYVGDQKYRTLVFGFSLEKLDARIQRTWQSAAILCFSFILAGAVAAFLVGRGVTRPLKVLAQEAATIASGNLEHQIRIRSSDEVGLLAQAFERMRRSLRSHIADIARKALSLEGDLRVFALPDLIQFISAARRTGCLVILQREREAKIYFEDGEVVHALAGQLSGPQAVFQIFNWTRGAFRFDPGSFDVERSIRLPWQHLVMEGARQTDEMDRIRQLISTPEMIVEVCEPPEGMEHIRLTMDELKVSLLARERRSVGEILAASHLDELQTYKVLYRLLTTGLLRTVGDGSRGRRRAASGQA